MTRPASYLHWELVETAQQALSDADAGREFAYADAYDAIAALGEQLEVYEKALREIEVRLGDSKLSDDRVNVVRAWRTACRALEEKSRSGERDASRE